MDRVLLSGLLSLAMAACQGVTPDQLELEASGARAAREGLSISSPMEEVFAKASALKVPVVRTWAFNDAPEKAGDTAMQIGPLQYDETALRGLDLVLARASVHRVQLVLPLGNYWSDYGGARQYVLWAGLSRPMEGDPRFFTNRAVIDHYKNHLHRLLNRINTVDGLPYGDHPAVLAWELLNEPRNRGLDDQGEGHFRKNLESPFIDFGSAHYFPETWNVASEQIASGGARWIHEHARTARQLGKPLFLGEFALRNDGGFALPERRAMYRGWLACARKTGLANCPLGVRERCATRWLDPPKAEATLHADNGTVVERCS